EQKPYKMAAPTSRRPSALGEQDENSNGLDTRKDLSKQYFKLLQALHHLEILNSAIERESYPIGMTRQVDKLTSFIKPAAPNATILGKVASNTKAWLCNNVIALRDHYALLANTIQTELGMFQPQALERAVRWARARYGRKLTQSSLETLRSRLLITLGPPAAYHQQGSFKETNNSDSPWLTSEQQEPTDWPAIHRPKRGPRTRPSHALKGKRKIVTLSASMVEIHRAATDMSLTPLITPIQSLTPHSPAPTSTNSPPQMHPLVKELLEIEEATHPVLNTSVEQSKTSITVMPPVNLNHDLPLTDFSIAQTGQQPTPVATRAQAAMYVTVKEESTQKMFQVNNCVSFTQLDVISQPSESIPLVAPQPPGPDYRTAVDTQLPVPAPLPGPYSPHIWVISFCEPPTPRDQTTGGRLIHSCQSQHLCQAPPHQPLTQALLQPPSCPHSQDLGVTEKHSLITQTLQQPYRTDRYKTFFLVIMMNPLDTGHPPGKSPTGIFLPTNPPF